jgi:UDP-N-acetylmuramate dehydrogenase
VNRPGCGLLPGADLDDLASELERALPGRVVRGLPVAELSTYRLGGPIAVAVRVGREPDLQPVAVAVARHAPPVLVIGRGSNLLVADSGFAGLGLVLDGDLETLALPEPTGAPGAAAVVSAGGAVPLPVLARRTAAAGWTGLEFFVGIPGSVGGAVRMNAGGHGRETADVLEQARTCDLATGRGDIRERDLDGLDLGYRHSAVGGAEVVTAATFRVTRDDTADCEARVAEIVRWRREHQPGGANAGSVFRNPEGDSAGRLIDACGLKGFRVGGAFVSPKHANFFQADTDATASDVRALVVEVARRVEAETGVRLVPELQMVGFDEADVAGGDGGGG